MKITKDDNVVEIQYQGKRLTVQVKRKSAMERYVFKGDYVWLWSKVTTY